MIKRLKILATVLFTALSTIYFTCVFLSLFMIYVLSFPSSGPEVVVEDRIIDYAVGSVVLVVNLICAISCVWFLYRDNVKFVFTLPIYLFLPLGVPYFLVMRKLRNHNEFYVIYSHSFSQFLLLVTSIINYLLALSPLMMGIMLIIAGWVMPIILYFGLPITVIALSMIIGTTANLIDNWKENKIASKMAYIGLTFVWIYRLYRVSLLKNGLYEVSYKKTSL